MELTAHLVGWYHLPTGKNEIERDFQPVLVTDWSIFTKADKQAEIPDIGRFYTADL